MRNLVTFAAPLLAAVLSTAGAQAATALQTYNIIPGTAGVAGFSSGGFMAVQTAVAYATLFPAGFGVLAGGPFDCARHQVKELCDTNNTPDISQPTADMRSWSGNQIDNVAELARRRLYLWVGTNDTVVGPNPMDQLYQQMLNFVPGDALRYDKIQGLQHAIAYGNQNGAVNTLSWLYGALNPPAAALAGQLVQFNQGEFIDTNHGMDPTGLLYVPPDCANGKACKLLVYFHGCAANYNQAGINSFAGFVLNYYADTNDIMILYPQTISDPTPRTDVMGETIANTDGCWDFRGLYGADFDMHDGAQVGAVAAMAKRIMGAAAVTPQSGFWWNPNEPGRGFAIEVSPTDGTLYFSGFMFESDGDPAWYSAVLTPAGGSTYVGPLSQYRGGQTLTSAYQPPSQHNFVASMSLTFPAANLAAMAIEAPGMTTTSIGLQRYSFVANGLTQPPNVTQPQTGWWWNPNAPGSGWFLEVQGGAMMVTGYMYDPSGDPFWYVGQNGMASNSSFTATLTQMGNGQTLGGTYQSPGVVNPNVGNVSINFPASDGAQMSLPNGAVIPLQRYRF